MNFMQVPLTAKMAMINALLAAALIALVTVAWRQLPTFTEAAEVAQLGRAQRSTQNADMMHDALHADVLAAIIATNASPEAKDNVRRSVRENGLVFRGELAALSAMPLSPALKSELENARGAGSVYVDEAELMVQLALVDTKAALERRPKFDQAFEAAKIALAAQTDLIAAQLDAANATAKKETEEARRWLLVAGGGTVIVGWLIVALIARSIRTSLLRISDVARAVAAGDLERRSDRRGEDEVGQIAAAVNQMADALSQMISKMRSDANRGAFGAQLVAALDMADSEKQASGVVERAMLEISNDHPMELLLADSSDAHLERAAAHPKAGAAKCPVDSPFSCIAVRRGHAVTFDDSEALDACPKLRGRSSGAVAATCVPVTFMGRALGVLHACGPTAAPLPQDAQDRLKTLGAQVGARIGTVRAFERTQMQASTDALTGLANRRAAETKMRELLQARKTFAFVMADLDHFKLLNDTHGHNAGDEALRVFADIARESVRQADLAVRWGGEEFCFLLVDSTGEQAMQWVERVRDRLARELRRRSAPAFTASFGVTDSQRDLPLEAIVGVADMALYRAKAEGRNRGVLALPDEADLHSQVVRRSEQTAELDVRMLANAG